MKKLLFIFCIAFLLTGCTSKDNATEVDTTEVTITEEETTEDASSPYVLTFEAKTIDGETITSDIFAKSELTMINVWATYCNPCLMEMPYLGEIANAYNQSEFQMIGIVSDVTEEGKADDIQTAKDLIKETKADYPHLLLSQSLYTNLVGAVEAVPTTFFINQKGEMLGYITGANTKEGWEEIINDVREKMEQQSK